MSVTMSVICSGSIFKLHLIHSCCGTYFVPHFLCERSSHAFRKFLSELAEVLCFSGARHCKGEKIAVWPHDSQSNFQGNLVLKQYFVYILSSEDHSCRDNSHVGFSSHWLRFSWPIKPLSACNFFVLNPSLLSLDFSAILETSWFDNF